MVKSKKLLATILTICMMVQLFACVTMASAMTQVWDGTVAESYTGGTGTADDPYIISSAAELAYMSAQVGAGVDLNAYYKLGADITFNENLLGEDGLLSKTPSVSFTPIGKLLTSLAAPSTVTAIQLAAFTPIRAAMAACSSMQEV